jgi:tRNA nucleotidyltransferase (CCA-adding enzyme)
VVEIKSAGGTSYMVGGAVRDLVLDYPIKDADIEVHGLTSDQLQKVLEKFGKVELIGKQFGVFRLHRIDVDWALPRTDSKGRKPTVKIDPDMDIKTACRRRDLTMNAMAIDLNFVCQNIKNKTLNVAKDLKIIDPYGGLDDIKSKTLRAVDLKLFTQDPLRFFRVMQFIARFEMSPDEKLNKLCSKMPISYTGKKALIAKERIHEEIKKMFLKSESPSLGFRWLVKINRLKELFSELEILRNVPQNPKYHPEGNVFEHTMQALDSAANIEFYEKEKLEEEKYLISLAAICHDLGKAKRTDPQLHCKKHEVESMRLTPKLLKKLTNSKTIIKAVQKLTLYHCAPLHLTAQGSSLKAYKKLAIKLAPETNLRQLALLWLADNRGRNKNSTRPLTHFSDNFLKFIEKAQVAKVSDKPEPPVLLGRHLIDSVKPGPKMGKLLKEAYRIQIEHGITDWKKLKKLVVKS